MWGRLLPLFLKNLAGHFGGAFRRGSVGFRHAEQGAGPVQALLQGVPDGGNMQQDAAGDGQLAGLQAAFPPAGFRQLRQAVRGLPGDGFRRGVLLFQGGAR